MPDDKRITIRFDPAVWDRLDDKRHGQRTTFQDVGARLFADWLGAPKSDRLVPISEQIAPPIATESDSEIYSLLSRLNIKQEDLGGDLLKILKSDKALAKEYVRLGILAGMRCLKYDE